MKSVCDNCINKACVWRAETDSSDPPVMDCPHFAKKPMTNADKIRFMTDEELAQFLADNNFGCPHHADCPSDGDDFCVECWFYWLKKEADNG